jgi:hypothetical protein
MQWALAGSYYIRSGIQDFKEPWGELTGREIGLACLVWFC